MPTLLIERLQNAKKLSKSQQKVTQYLKRAYRQIPFLSASDIAQSSQVSKATVIRTVQQLGYSGLDDLRNQLRSALYSEQDSPVQRAQKHSKKPEVTELLKLHKRQELSNIRNTLDALNPDSMHSLCERLVSAKRIWVYGQRFSYGLAFNLALFLAKLLPDVVIVSGEGGTTADSFSMARPSDYVLIVAHKRFGTEKVSLANYLHEHNIPYSLITDAPDTAITSQAEFTFTATTSAVGAYSCYASSYTIIQALVYALEIYAPNMISRLTDTEIILDRLNAYEKKGGGTR